MNNLLHEEFARLLKSKIFWLCLIFAFGFAAVLIVVRWMDGMKVPEYTPYYTDVLFAGLVYLPFFMAAFVALFVGVDYSDGTLRNKIIVGHTRTDIYFAKFIVVEFCSLLFSLVYVITILALGFIFIGNPFSIVIDGIELTPIRYMQLLGICLAATMAFVSLLMLVVIWVQNKATSAVACLILSFALLAAGALIGSKLMEPEFNEAHYKITSETMEMEWVPATENPDYVSGSLRTVLEFANDTLPISQLFTAGYFTPIGTDKMMLMLGYDLVELVLFTSVGLFAFRRKDLK